ncbi:MAG TPA: alpha/beta fold hydrolase [Fimbriimonadaceae bacterium]|jgi:homoserine O-acetyltransferase
MISTLKFILTAGFAATCIAASTEGEQQFASIGDLNLQSGAVLKDCKVGYRTFGKMDAAKDNVVLVPTWYLGISENFVNSFKPGGLVDATKYYVIAVDALGNGVSTSPSNSTGQHDADFPALTIKDMVTSQHQMLIGLGIQHLHAVVGISMGGIQAFTWITAYPDFLDKAVPIVGSPKPTSYDLMFDRSAIKAMDAALAHPDSRDDLIRAFADYFWLSLTTPSYNVEHTKRETAVESMSGFEKALLAWDIYDMKVDLDAICTNDAFAPLDEAAAIKAIHAKVLVISAVQDHAVNPAPALSFAKASGSQILLLTGNPGHSSPGMESKRVNAAVDTFLSR